VNKIKLRLFLPFLLLATSLACSAVAKVMPPAVTILAAPDKSATWDAASLQKASEIIAGRLKARAAGQFSVQVTGGKQINVALFDVKDLDVAQRSISEMGVVVFADVQKSYYPGDEIDPQSQAILTQVDFQSAEAQKPEYGDYNVAFTLTAEGTKKLAEYTRANVGHFLAIVRDGRVVSCPRVTGEIAGGEGIISGTFTQQEAEELAFLLTHPPLPFPLVVVEIKK